MARVLSITGRQTVALDQGWEFTATAPGEVATPADLTGPRLWLPAPVPGTVAQALRDSGRWSLDAPTPLHNQDFWYRTCLPFEGERILRFHGLATVAEVWLNNEQRLCSDSMFMAYAVPVRLTGCDVLHLVFRALHPVLDAKSGRGRWRSRMIEHRGLRSVRTTLLGHMPGWCPPVHAVGPWRAVECIEESSSLRVLNADLRTVVDGRDGVLTLDLLLEGQDVRDAPAFVTVGGRQAPLLWDGPHRLHGQVRVPDVDLWWPHTHGSPVLHHVHATMATGVGEVRMALGRVGFRTIESGDNFALRINGEPLFCRGACWSCADIVSLPGDRGAYAPWLELMVRAGMNMVRVGGTMLYESDAFFDLCDELGLLVWQDFMFATLDYPTDEAFLAAAAAEAAHFLDRVQASPSLAVLCGGSEAMQQAAMLGLPRPSWTQPLFEEVLPREARRLRPDVPYVPNSPSGGPLPFAVNQGVAHYYGVGAYLRPLEDARRAEVSFAAECLAFANVPDTPAAVPAVHHPKWKERVPRDAGASWDFEDVRDHYLQRLYGVDPAVLRYQDPGRYLRLSRAVTGDVMEAVFAEWRRGRSPCAGGLVWMFQDLWPGAGWGVVDSTGRPKAAWHALRRAFRPIQVTLTDEGVNGLAVHLINETAQTLPAMLTLVCLRDGALPVARGGRSLSIPARGVLEIPASALLDAFFDTSYAYRFGPPAHDSTVATLSDADGVRLAEAFHFPHPPEPRDLGLDATVAREGEGWVLRLRSRRLARAVHIDDAAFRAEEDWFHLPPDAERIVRLIPSHGAPGGVIRVPDGEVHALNGFSPVRFRGMA